MDFPILRGFSSTNHTIGRNRSPLSHLGNLNSATSAQAVETNLGKFSHNLLNNNKPQAKLYS